MKERKGAEIDGGRERKKRGREDEPCKETHLSSLPSLPLLLLLLLLSPRPLSSPPKGEGFY
jgi:hypothetical protein